MHSKYFILLFSLSLSLLLIELVKKELKNYYVVSVLRLKKAIFDICMEKIIIMYYVTEHELHNEMEAFSLGLFLSTHSTTTSVVARVWRLNGERIIRFPAN